MLLLVLSTLYTLYTISMNTVSIKDAIKVIESNGVGILPTDTVYGLVASAHSPSAVERLYDLKSRHKKPGTLIAASIEQLKDLGFQPQDITPVQNLWPNPLSIVLPLDKTYLTQGLGNIAVRIPKSEDTKRILQRTGPLLTTSANQPGEPEATTIEKAYAYFKDSVDFYVDIGELVNHPSTIAKFENGELKVIRQGDFSLSKEIIDKM